MKLEQNMMLFTNTTGTKTGYIDLARAASALNGRMISQTKRSKGKYKPLGFLIRVRALVGSVGVHTANCGYPTRNAVVLAGAARDAMLKSAGVSRGNLESYQKELRLKFDCTQTDANLFVPGATEIGAETEPAPGNAWQDAYGAGLTYDYTSIVFDKPSSPGTDVSQTLVLHGGKPSGDVGDETCAPVIYNWHAWRHSFTPSAGADDIADNVFSYAMQQSSTADKIIDIVEDEADEKPYAFDNFHDSPMYTLASTAVGNPQTSTICAPLGLLKVNVQAGTQFEVEIVGVVEL